MDVLIVEDEPHVSYGLELLVNEVGHHVIGPASSIKAGRSLQATEHIDTALLDLHVGAEFSYGLAEELIAAGVCVVFLTAHRIDPKFDGTLRLHKPYAVQSLLEMLVHCQGVTAPPIAKANGLIYKLTMDDMRTSHDIVVQVETMEAVDRESARRLLADLFELGAHAMRNTGIAAVKFKKAA